MRMRVGVLWSAAALALLAVSSALRTPQAEARTSRRLAVSLDSETNSPTTTLPESVPNNRSRFNRRQETPQDVSRIRARSKPETTERAEPQRASANERFDSRRTRTRTRPETQRAEINNETFKNVAIRSRSRPRRPTTQSPEVSSPIDAKIEANTNVDDIPRIATKQDNRATSQFRRRSSTVPTETVTLKRERGRINTRPKIIPQDQDSSGSTNTILITDKAPTTARTSADLRDGRKLRYKTRPLETDTNLTGEGIVISEVNSSQIENATSQSGTETAAPVFVERIVQQSTETNKPTTTLKVTRIVRRPVSRGKATQPLAVPKKKSRIDDIDEDDNYPESFKALIQAKNATQANSLAKESLSVTASQKVINTYSSTLQSTQNDPAENNHSRLRIKQTDDESRKSTNEEELLITKTPEVILKSDRYKKRGKYSVPTKRTTTLRPDSSTANSIDKLTEKQGNKYSRKFKFTTTTQTSRTNNNDENNTEIKKPAIRPSFTSRKLGKKIATSTEVSFTVSEKKEETILRKRVSLPRTSYYSRLRNKTETTTSTEAPNEIMQKKTENTADMPLIFTLLNHSENKVLVSDSLRKEENETKEPFLISISSTESQENMLSNDVKSNLAKGAENTTTPSPLLATKEQDLDKQKYHANFKNPKQVVIEDNLQGSSTVPPVRNLQRRRQKQRQKEKIEDSLNSTTARGRDRNVRKFSEAFSKTTEASNNGIIAGAEKAKSKFSSKYRASYLDKPFYKPTVPSITSSTAWLKFFVTDHLLTQSVEEPNWYRDLVDETTESAANASPSYIHSSHPSSIELVEGEEMQLGPDNAISITQTRRTLSSADLRLSESLLKSSQVMNVEASHHSPSVTVSIFDALAEILTSTPKTRLSSTTEVTKNPTLNTDVTQILNGVSNIVNVNSTGGITSPEVFVPASASTTTQSVQNTDQTTPIVINNNMSAGESVTQSLNTEVVTPSTPQTPIPIPTTPLSARRPFAIKVLYSNTESSTDKTSTTSDLTSNPPTTDNPTMVYNTVSDLLLSSNKLVSSELTSMLSNNIRSIIQNMDEESRSRISVDMAKLLKNLIPRAIDGLATRHDSADFISITTPYSLEDIKDTENIDINTNLDTFDILRSVTTDNSANSVTGDSNLVTISTVFADNPSPIVNNLDATEDPTSESDSQTTSKDFPITIQTDSRAAFENIANTPTIPPTFVTSTEAVTSSGFVTDPVVENVNSNIMSSDNTNKTVPLPFLSNFLVKDFISNDSEVINFAKSVPSNKEMVGASDNSLNPSNVSPLQLWVLSKKANVLKMIEDLIRQHNNELATAPTFAEIVSPVNRNINLSERLTNIMNTMTLTTDSSTMTTTSDVFFSNIPFPNTDSPTTTVQTLQTDNGSSIIPGLEAPQDDLQTTTEVLIDPSIRFGIDTGNEKTDSTPTTESTSRNTAVTTTERTRNQDPYSLGLSTTASSFTTTNLQETTETTTASAITETTTQFNIEMAQADDESTTQTYTETTTVDINITPAVTFNATSPTIPKKDYVIFGILPNNTVVRKDPNDDALESLTEASPYIVYGLLPNNTVIRKFPNGTKVPRIMQKIDILPISPWSLRNPYSPIHNNPAIVRPMSNPIRVSTNTVTFTDITNNGTDTVNNQQIMISSSALNNKSSLLSITTVTNKPPGELSTASHVLSLRTTTMLPSIDEILLNSLSSAAKQEMVISSMMSSTREPTILTLDIDPETKQIRTESDGDGNAVFKFIPINEVMVKQQNTNVFKLATKANTESSEVQIETVTKLIDVNTRSSQTQSNIESTSTTTQETTMMTNSPFATFDSTTVSHTTEAEIGTLTTTQAPTTTQVLTTTLATTTQVPSTTSQAPFTTTQAPTTTTTRAPTTTEATTTQSPTTTTPPITTTQQPRTTIQATSFDDSIRNYIATQNAQNSRDPKYLNVQSFNNLLNSAESTTTKNVPKPQENDPSALLQALLSATGNNNAGLLSNTNPTGNTRVLNKEQTTTSHSLEEDIRQFEEDTKLLKALLAATGQNPADLNIPSLDAILSTTSIPTTQTTTIRPITTSNIPTTTTTTTAMPRTTQASTTQSLQDDLKQFQEDAKLLQALLQATGQSTGNINLPDISQVTSNVRIASNPLSTQIGSKPATPVISRPVYTTTNGPVFATFAPRTVSTLAESSTTEDIRISTTFVPFTQRSTTSRFVEAETLSGRQAPPRFSVTTEAPSSSTFSVEEDLVFLNNLKQVLNTNNGDVDPETALANRIISLAVDRSLTEIQTGNAESGVRTGKTIANGANNLVSTTPTTTTTSTTTTTTTTTTPRTITTQATTQRPLMSANIPEDPSLEADIKQFQEDTKLLQALIKATGQDPSKFNIPTLPNIISTVSSHNSDGLKLSTIASPSRYYDATLKPSMLSTNILPFGAKIAVMDNLKTVMDDKKLLKTLIKLQGAQETTTFRSKLVGTGQTSDEALKKLIQQQKASGMVSEATKSPISLSTEYGKSNDALLAALLKEQGFGPTTASSIDEQVRLAALLNQVVVTPKARRTTTPPPPPPPPRRPVLDGLAWLWQQWRETSPGPAPTRSASQRPGPAPAVRPSEATSNRVNWFGSGPFQGNADDRPASSNRIPLEPPRAVTSDPGGPGRGQLVSAAINMTRAFSQFLGAAFQGAAQTVQSVIRAGTRAATDVYSNGSGSG